MWTPLAAGLLGPTLPESSGLTAGNLEIDPHAAHTILAHLTRSAPEQDAGAGTTMSSQGGHKLGRTVQIREAACRYSPACSQRMRRC